MSIDRNESKRFNRNMQSRAQQSLVTRFIRAAASDAEATAATFPPVNVSAVMDDAAVPILSILRTWIPRTATAAAILAAALGTLLVVRPHPLPNGLIPPHMIALVDSLYSETDYVHDELIDILWPQATESDYLDDVWGAVVEDPVFRATSD